MENVSLLVAFGGGLLSFLSPCVLPLAPVYLASLYGPEILDTSQAVALKYNIRSIPTTFSIDKDGIIRAFKIGAFTSAAEIESGLDKIMP